MILVSTRIMQRPGAEAQAVTVNGQTRSSTRRDLHGFDFDAVDLHLAGQTTVQVA